MKKLYILLFFACLVSFAKAQEAKSAGNTSLSEINQPKAIKFFPNPATTVINFELIKGNQREMTLQVYNFVGKKVYEQNNINPKTSLSLSEFYRGVYIFQLRDKAGRIIESGKFQVVK